MFTQVPRVFYQHPRRCHHRGSSWSKTNCTRAVCISNFALNLRINSSAEWMIWNDMKWYEMIWNDMKWYEMIWNERNHRTHVSQDVPSLWCDTLWHSALRNVQAQGLDFTVLQIMVRMHWMRSWNRKICSSVWHEALVNLLDRKSTKRIQERHSWHC